MKLIKLQKTFTLYILMVVIPVFAIAILTLNAPSTNANGTESGNYTEVEDVGNVTTVSIYELPDIQSGIWYFAVTAHDISGNEGDYSNEVRKEIT